MRKTFCLTMVVILAGLNIAMAQSLDEILKQHFEAVGQEKIVNAKSYWIKASVSQMGMEIPMEMKVKNPDKFRIEMQIQGNTMVQAYDGKSGWMIIPMMGPDPQVLEGGQLDQAREQVDLEGELYNYKKKGHKLDFIGRVNLDGKETYKLKLSSESKGDRTYFIDAASKLIVKAIVKVSAMGQEVEIEQKMGDFKNFDGVEIATKMESKTPMGTVSVIVNEFQCDKEFDDGIFAMPGN